MYTYAPSRHERVLSKPKERSPVASNQPSTASPSISKACPEQEQPIIGSEQAATECGKPTGYDKKSSKPLRTKRVKSNKRAREPCIEIFADSSDEETSL